MACVCHGRRLLPLGMLEWEAILRISGQPLLGHRETLLDTVYSLAVILAFLAFDKVTLPFSKQLEELGSKSFGIYLVHSPVMEVVARGIYHVVPWILAYQILFLPIMFVTGLGIPLLLMRAVNKSPARRYYKVLFG